MTHPDPLTYFARTNFRGTNRPFGIRQRDRFSHTYLVGKTGTGKSTLLETMITQDILRGSGVAVLDPHGDLAERIVEAVPASRRSDLIFFDVPDTAAAMGFNPLEQVPVHMRPLAAANMLEVFKKIWADSWGPRLEHILRNALLVLMDQPEASLADVNRLLSDPQYRKKAAARTANAQVREFWLTEFANLPARFRAESIAPVQNKVGAFLASPVLNRILTQPTSSFDLREVMDEGKILVVNLAKGKLGEDTSMLLGALLVARLGLSGLGRADVPPDMRRPFFVYLDEFQSFATASLAGMLSELRKYQVGLVLAHQYLTQLTPPVRDAVLGNVGTLVSFRIGPEDTRVLEKEFGPEFTANDLVNLPNYNLCVRLMVEGATTRPFSGETIQASEIRRLREARRPGGPSFSPSPEYTDPGGRSLTEPLHSPVPSNGGVRAR